MQAGVPVGVLAPSTSKASELVTPPAKNILPPPRAIPHESRWYLVPCLLIVAAAVALLYWGYSQAALPPGGDPGHWIATAQEFVGLPHVTGDFTLQPGLYPPLTFPLLGAVLWITGGPVAAGFVFGGLLLVVYGLSCIHLARRYLGQGSLQVLFVGLAVLNGTTLQILFWGGYPNFLALIFFNEALVFLLSFSRTRSSRDALLLYGMISLAYLTHDLTFDILIATMIIAGVFLLIQDRRWLKLFVSWPNAYGVALLAGTIAAYTGITDLLGIPHPGYLFTNPAAYVLQNLGELFRVMGYAPLWLPFGAPVVLNSTVMLAILLGVAAAVVVLMVVVRSLRPGWVSPRLTLALAALTAALVLPAAGWLLHIDTDYPRFAFFFAVPLGLTLTICLERFLRPWTNRIPFVPPAVTGTTVPTPEIPSLPAAGWSLDRRPSWWAINVGVAVVLILLCVEVSVPTVSTSEQQYAEPIHDANFIQALDWLRSNGTAGAVLADTGDTQRWVEAMTQRNALAPGLTYLDFYSAQVLGDEQSYFAQNTHYVISNNQVALSMTGYSNNSLNGTPQFSVFDEGVIIPILRVNASSIVVNVTDTLTRAPSFVVAYNNTWLPTPVVFQAVPSPTLTFGFRTPYFWLNETAQVGTGDAAVISVGVTATSGYKVDILRFDLTQPQPNPLAHWNSGSATRDSELISWTTGPIPGLSGATSPIRTSVVLSQQPSVSSRPIAGPPGSNPVGFHLAFSTGATDSASYNVSLQIQAPGTSNPATTFPTYFDTQAFLEENDIHFFMLQNVTGNGRIVAYYESEFGFEVGITNPTWTVLWRAG
jgi:hypothetical protein